MDNDEKTPASSDDRAGRNAAHHDRTDSDAPTERLDGPSTPASGAPIADTENPGRGRGRTRRILVGAGAAAALLAFGGGAFAIGAAVADDDEDERPGIHMAGSHDGDHDGQPGQGRGDDDQADRDDRDGDGAAASAPVDEASLRAAAEAAIESASAEGITSIEVERGGYEIDARLADGTEVDLFVTAEGEVRERGDDDADDDDAADPLIDLGRLGDILAAAQSAAGDAGANESAFHALSTSGSGAVYEIELRGDDRSEVEVELDADLGVVRVDVDS